MTKSATPRIEASIREYLAPTLRVDGFSGSGRTYRRVAGDLIHVLSVQGSRFGGQFAVNLAIHPLCIPDLRGEIPDPAKITDELCEFRRRLSGSGADQWWKHDGTADSMNDAVRSACTVYADYGRILFSAFFGAATPVHTVTAMQFADDQYSFSGFGSTKVRMALALARFRAAGQQMREAHAFASIGLAGVGAATTLRDELDAIRAAAQQVLQADAAAPRGLS